VYTEVIQKHIVLPLEKATNAIFSQKYNPFYYHGALPNLFIWVLFITGLLLMVYYKPTLQTAYTDVQFLTSGLPFGNLIRSLHRYAADGMMVFVIIHLLRVWFTDRFREYRILPWVTGIILLSITFIVGLTGYLLIWDQDAVSLTYATINLLNKLPLVGPSLARFWLSGDIVNDYTLTMIFATHLAVPMLLMFFLWMHYLRITRPVTNAPVPLCCRCNWVPLRYSRR
jgi:cytochrome b6